MDSSWTVLSLVPRPNFCALQTCPKLRVWILSLGKLGQVDISSVCFGAKKNWLFVMALNVVYFSWSIWCNSMPMCWYNYAPALQENVSRPNLCQDHRTHVKILVSGEETRQCYEQLCKFEAIKTLSGHRAPLCINVNFMLKWQWVHKLFSRYHCWT